MCIMIFTVRVYSFNSRSHAYSHVRKQTVIGPIRQCATQTAHEQQVVFCRPVSRLTTLSDFKGYVLNFLAHVTIIYTFEISHVI